MSLTVDAAQAKGPILLLDPGSIYALGAARGLGRAGWRVVTAGHEPAWRSVVAHSRSVASHHRVTDPRGPAEPFDRSLRRVIEGTGAIAIVPAFDATIARLGTIAPPLPVVPTLGAALEAVTDKYRLAEACGRAGVAYPASWLPDDPALPRNDELIVKPRRTALPDPQRVATRTGARVARSGAELDEAVRELTSLGLEPIVQRRVDRAFKINVSIVRSGGTTSARIAYRVLREIPPAGGIAAATETIDGDAGRGLEALQATEAVCDAAGYEGIANAEFYGQADGSLCLIEINTRIWGSVWLPEQLGLEFTGRAVEHALGLPPRPAVSYEPGRRFHRTTLELRWLLSRSPDRGPRSSLLRSTRPGDVFDVVSWSDPRPMAATATRLASSAAAELGRRLLSRRRG